MIIGRLKLEKPLCLAPMEDVSDLSFRRIAREMGADIVYTEFTSSEALIRDIPRALKKIEINDLERPVGIQIYGGVEESMEGAAKIAESFNPDLIDINCGCWVKNHVQRCECAGLLRDLKLFERIVRATVRATTKPVTVKTRLGWDESSIVILDVARMLEANGVKALTIHCRTRVQGYKGPAQWRWLEKIRKATSLPLIGNGDVATGPDARAMFESGCDGVMIGRAAIANPFVFREIKHYLSTGEALTCATPEERVKLCLRHLHLSIQYKGLYRGIMEFRKYYVGYFHGQPNIAKLRADLMKITDLKSITDRLYQYLEEQSPVSV